MSTTVWVIIVVAILVLAALVFSNVAHRRRVGLRQRFGDEYDRTVDAAGGRRAAERDLRDRAGRRDQIEVHDIDPQRRQVLVGEWVGVQASFVDDPAAAVRGAERLVHATMTERGYPDGSADNHIDLVSVDYPELAPELRRARETSAGRANGGGVADTEALRKAMLRYRGVFDRMLEPQSRSGRT